MPIFQKIFILLYLSIKTTEAISIQENYKRRTIINILSMAEKSINIASWPCLSNGLHYNWLVDYAAFSAFGTFELSAEEWEKRDLIVNFKGNSELTTEIDHQQAVDKAIDLVSSFLKAVFSEKEETTNPLPTLSQLTLVCH